MDDLLPHRLQLAPCGECGTLVDRLAGCPHWRPAKAMARAVKARQERETISRRKRAATGRAAVQEFARQMGVS